MVSFHVAVIVTGSLCIFQIMHSLFSDLIRCSDLFKILIGGLIELHEFYTMV